MQHTSVHNCRLASGMLATSRHCWQRACPQALALWRPYRVPPSTQLFKGAACSQPPRASGMWTSALSSPDSSSSSSSRPASPAGPGGPPAPTPKRFAVVGGGFAGVAVAWHLLSRASPTNPISLDLFDAHGQGSGGSGAAAGLLHPYTNRGKVLWRGLEAFQAAIELVEAAEAAAAAASSDFSQDTLAAEDGTAEPFTWRNGILRPARSDKQARDLAKFVPQDAATAAATAAELLTAAQLEQLVPGMPVGRLIAEEQAPPLSPSQQAQRQRQRDKQQQQQRQRRQKSSQGGQQQQQQPAGGSSGLGTGPAPPAEAAGLIVHSAVVLHPLRYLQAVWAACGQLAQRAGQGSAAHLVLQQVSSLQQLESEGGPYDAVVVAAGAAVGCIEEMRDVLPIQLCQGYTLVMEPPSPAAGAAGTAAAAAAALQEAGTAAAAAAAAAALQEADAAAAAAAAALPEADAAAAAEGYPANAPSLLGSTYISAHGPASLVVGATKRYGLTPEQAMEECCPTKREVAGKDEWAAAAAALLPPAAELWPPVAGWRVAQVKSGVRALPARGSEGAIPFAGRIPAPSATASGQQDQQQEHHHQEQQQQEQQPQQQEQGGNWWFIGGLGARGLVYHAWLGKLVAQAVVEGSEAALPAELLRWRDGAGSAAASAPPKHALAAATAVEQ